MFLARLVRDPYPLKLYPSAIIQLVQDKGAWSVDTYLCPEWGKNFCRQVLK